MAEVSNRLEALEEHKLQAHAFKEANPIRADASHSRNPNESSVSASGRRSVEERARVSSHDPSNSDRHPFEGDGALPLQVPSSPRPDRKRAEQPTPAEQLISAFAELSVEETTVIPKTLTTEHLRQKLFSKRVIMNYCMDGRRSHWHMVS